MGMRWFLVLSMLIPLAAIADPPAFDTGSILRFNTVCAYCHEGQCSGRLSFSLGPEAAFNHIRRYAGDVDEALTRQLQALLVHMKQKCAYAPLPPPDMRGPLQREILDLYLDSATRDYFIPLGKLEPGRYRLELRFEAPASLRVEVLNERFEFLVDECTDRSHSVLPVTVEVDEAADHFLRLRSPAELYLEELRLTPEADGSRR